MPIVNLRTPLPADVAARVALGRSPAIAAMYGAIGDPSTAISDSDAHTWFTRLSAHPHAWVITADGALAGDVRLHNLDPTDRRASLAIGLFADRDLGRGIGRRAIALALDHAFGPLGLHRVSLRVLATNTRAIRCYLSCGFVVEGTERQSARVGDAWQDDLIMGILAHEHIQAGRR
jgi:RimJ/RimL family protein N-acetyltransferase